MYVCVRWGGGGGGIASMLYELNFLKSDMYICLVGQLFVCCEKLGLTSNSNHPERSMYTSFRKLMEI